jgi:hypothetical protein
MKEYDEIMGNVIASDVIRYLKKLDSDEDRFNWLEKLKKEICLYCGTKQEGKICQCWRDE